MATTDYFLCPVDDLLPDPAQPRQTFDEEELNALAKSISEKGVLLPIIVRSGPDRLYEIVAGERRWRAAKIAGLSAVPVLVKDLSNKAAFELAVIENTQRSNLNPIEESLAFKRLLEEHDLPQTEIAELVGRSRVYVTNSLRLLSLEPQYQALLVEGRLNARQARILLTVTGEQRAQLAQLLEQGMGTAEAEAWSRKSQDRVTGKHKPNRLKTCSPYENISNLAKNCLNQAYPDVSVSLQFSGRSGSVMFSFESLHGLCGLLSKLTRGEIRK